MTTDNQPTTTDILILGGGPGGMAALLWANSVGLRALMLEQAPELGGQLLQMFHPVIDYPGLLPTSGSNLRDLFQQQLESLQLGYRLNCHIEAADLAGRRVLCNGKWISAQAIVIATGARQRRLGIPGEEIAHHFDPHEGFTYDNQNVCVIGGGDSAVENANILAHTAAHVTLVHRSESFRARAEWLATAQTAPNVTILTHTKPIAIHAERVELEDMLADTQQTLPVAATFIRAGIVPNTELFAEQIELDETGWLNVNQQQQTSLPLVYAIGDVCKPVCLSVATAVGHAAVAVKDIQARLT